MSHQEEQSHVQGFDEHIPRIPNPTPDAPLPSARSVQQSLTEGNPDHLIIHPSNYIEIIPNNHHIDFDNIKINPVIKEVLRNHPLAYALTHTVNVPMLYLQQAWKTITATVENDRPIFVFQIDEFITKLDFQRLRLILRLPARDSREGKTDFDPYPSEEEVFRGIRDMGYTATLTKVKGFNKANLPPLYYTIFSVINRCLTAKHAGTDTASIPFLKLFHAVVYDLHVDYVATFWHELSDKIELRRQNKGKPYIPYMRFLQIIIHSMLRSNKEIPRRLHHPSVPEKAMQYLQMPKRNYPYEMPLPEGFLSYADQDAECIVEYRESMVRPEPEGPTPDSIPRREESVRVQDARATEREELRENTERGTGGVSHLYLKVQDHRLRTHIQMIMYMMLLK